MPPKPSVRAPDRTAILKTASIALRSNSVEINRLDQTHDSSATNTTVYQQSRTLYNFSPDARLFPKSNIQPY
jgi:hypothetical protein